MLANQVDVFESIPKTLGQQRYDEVWFSERYAMPKRAPVFFCLYWQALVHHPDAAVMTAHLRNVVSNLYLQKIFRLRAKGGFNPQGQLG